MKFKLYDSGEVGTVFYIEETKIWMSRSLKTFSLQLPKTMFHQVLKITDGLLLCHLAKSMCESHRWWPWEEIIWAAYPSESRNSVLQACVGHWFRTQQCDLLHSWNVTPEGVHKCSLVGCLIHSSIHSFLPPAIEHVDHPKVPGSALVKNTLIKFKCYLKEAQAFSRKKEKPTHT